MSLPPIISLPTIHSHPSWGFRPIFSSDIVKEKAPQDSSFPWNALADSIRSVTRDIEKEERKEEAQRERAVDVPDKASSPVVSKPGADSGGKEDSSVEDKQGKSSSRAEETSPTRCEHRSVACCSIPPALKRSLAWQNVLVFAGRAACVPVPRYPVVLGEISAKYCNRHRRCRKRANLLFTPGCDCLRSFDCVHSLAPRSNQFP